MKYSMRLLSVVCTTAMLGSAAQAQAEEPDLTLTGWDADNSTTVSLEEWDTAIEDNDVFNGLDDNNNGIFDIGEAADSPIDWDLAMDLDDGGYIERQEFTVALFDRYDANDDDMLDQNEFAEFGSAAGATASSTN